MFQRHHDLFNFTPIPMWVYHVKTLQILAANEAACRNYGRSLEEFLASSIDILLPPNEFSPSQIRAVIQDKQGLPNKTQVRHITKGGNIIDVDITSEPLPAWNEDTRIIVAIDVTEKRRAQQVKRQLNELNRLERNILELNSKSGIPIVNVLTAYLSGLDELLPQITCTIMQVRNNHIYNWAAPHFPTELAEAFDGLAVGPNAGSCGSAAFFKENIVVADIAHSKYWDNYKDAPIQAGFHACWSYPVIDSAGKVMGTFALYKKETSLPDQQEEQMIHRAVSLLTVILENRQFAEMINDNTELMKQGQALAKFGNWSWEIKDNLVSWSDELYEIYGLKKQEFLATFEAYQELLHVDDRDRVTALILNLLQTKEALAFEERIIRPNHEIRHLKSWATLKCDESGEPVKMIGACLDITESKKVLQELSASETRLRNLVDAQTNYVMRIDVFGFYTYYNSKFQQDFGWIYNKEDFTGEDATLSIMPTYRNKIMEVTFRCLEQPGKVIEVELMQPTINAEAKTLFWHMVALADQPDAAPEIQCIGIDVTEKVAAQAALAKSESRFKKLIQEGSDLISVFDVDGNFQYLSPTAQKFFGVSTNNLVGKNAFQFIHQDDQEEVFISLGKLNQEKRLELAPFRVSLPNGETRWLETIATDLTDDEAVGGIIANARDVTQRVMDEMTNKEHLERYNIVAKATSDTIWDLNLLTDEIGWNHGIKNVFGYPEYITSYKWWHDHVHPDDVNRVITLVDVNKERKIPRWSSEYRFQCADGSYKVVFDRGFLIFDDQGHPIRMIGAMQDITERMKYIQEIEQHNTRLQDIAWIQSHMVRGPLTRIMGLIPLFTDPEIDENTKQVALGYLKTSTDQLDQAIKEVVNKSQ